MRVKDFAMNVYLWAVYTEATVEDVKACIANISLRSDDGLTPRQQDLAFKEYQKLQKARQNNSQGL